MSEGSVQPPKHINRQPSPRLSYNHSELPMLNVSLQIERRNECDELLHRAENLPDAQRVPFEQFHRHCVPITQIARELKVDPQRMARSLKRTRRRLTSRLFVFWLNHGDQLPDEVRRVAYRFIVEGMGIRGVSVMTGLSLYTVRKHITTIKEGVRWQNRLQRFAKDEPRCGSSSTNSKANCHHGMIRTYSRGGDES